MERRLQISALAAEDLLDIEAWLTQPDAAALAAARLAHIQAAILGLRSTPCTWPKATRHPGLRERHVDGYVISYEVDPDTGDNRTAGDVAVMRIFGPWRDR